MINLCHYISHESFDVNVLLRASLVVLHIILPSHLASVILADPAVFLAINLVAD